MSVFHIVLCFHPHSSMLMMFFILNHVNQDRLKRPKGCLLKVVLKVVPKAYSRAVSAVLANIAPKAGVELCVWVLLLKVSDVLTYIHHVV